MTIEVGDFSSPTLTISNGDETTGVTLTVTDPIGVATTPTISGSGMSWAADSFEYTNPGLWFYVWSASGSGAGVTKETVSVTPISTTAHPRTYATTADLANWLGTAVPTDAARTLRRASEHVERITVTAVYDVDDDGLPTDADTLTAMKNAVCAICEYWIETADEFNIGSAQSATIGSVSITAVKDASVGVGGPGDPANIGYDAYTILLNAGLLNQPPQS